MGNSGPTSPSCERQYSRPIAWRHFETRHPPFLHREDCTTGIGVLWPFSNRFNVASAIPAAVAKSG
jgi:hypothetical protein